MSSYLLVAPEAVALAVADAAGIGSSIYSATTAAAPSMTSGVAAADDEVSAAIAALFSGHGQGFQAMSARLAVFHREFVRALGQCGGCGCGC